ncbi:LysE family transporter [[Haemophilus] ducreyi]|uniref:LysE family transporter n=1 Tax=Haemophilus ducreyi TaxID=730 RepID=UPI0006563E7C|nr:LysE family transporter [[Haemophilus] ducreyi]AKO45008.1 membrane protein [[Haemophilus] ducreyi]AKO46410.1 membrane protein [[Haemophilus] ducreyi]AKO47754.1 membrane protein [[Haemophilus] ducreyi]AKO49138.1 membrane protein [[Haemophilus] ducreyi]ANF62199.1 hypothetical protein A6037_05490 [[Haemophilus] ducreyi]
MLTIILVHLVGLASPGPDFFYVVRRSAGHSTKAGFLAAIGTSIGSIFWASFAIFGLAWLSNSAGTVFQHFIMLAGGIYLAYLGSVMVFSVKQAAFDHQKIVVTPLKMWTEVKKGLLINLANAKAGIYFTSVISVFMAKFNQVSDLFLLLFLFVISTLLYFGSVAMLFSRKPVQALYSKYNHYIENIAGMIFILFGLFLFYTGIKSL